MVEQNDLVARLKQYDSLLDRKIKEEERISSEESLQGSIASDQRESVYRFAQQELYRLFPEVKPKQD